jgi:hypothetical protein
MSLKNPVTSPGIDPGTVRLVAQRLNHYANPGPSTLNIEAGYSLKTSLQAKTPHNREESLQPHSSCAVSVQNGAVRCIRQPFQLVKIIIYVAGKYKEGKNYLMKKDCNKNIRFKEGRRVGYWE